MSREFQGASHLRCLAVWLAATAVLLAAIAVAHGELARDSRAGFDTVLTRGCALALAGCAAWFWLGATTVIIGAVLGFRGALLGCPGPLRRVLLVACGALLAPAPPALAEHDPPPAGTHVLAGLPLPDRPEIRGPGSTRPPAVTTVAVRPGDSLWAIAARSLPPGAGPAAVDVRWREIWAANRALVGPDPHLIHPGTELRLPAEES